MSIKQAKGPDIEGNSKDGLPDGSLPAGSVTEGMSGNVNPDGANLSGSVGYAKVGIADTMADQREGDEMGYAPTQSGGGFAKRPGGWER